jgi:hypothetical protein
LIYPGGIIVK